MDNHAGLGLRSASANNSCSVSKTVTMDGYLFGSSHKMQIKLMMLTVSDE